MRNLTINKYASGFGTLLILFPFIISVILTVAFLPSQTSTHMLYKYDGYDIDTPQNRDYWARIQFGGNWEKVWVWRLATSFPDFLGDWYYEFPDGTRIQAKYYENFLNNEGDFIDPYAIVWDLLALNPVALQQIGIFGVFIRIVMIVAVAVGIVEIVWIG